MISPKRSSRIHQNQIISSGLNFNNSQTLPQFLAPLDQEKYQTNFQSQRHFPQPSHLGNKEFLAFESKQTLLKTLIIQKQNNFNLEINKVPLHAEEDGSNLDTNSSSNQNVNFFEIDE